MSQGATELALPLDTENMQWSPTGPGRSFRPLRFAADGWSELMRLEPGSIVALHHHTGEVHAFNLSGTREIIGTGEAVGPGGYVYEPPGTIDTWGAAGGSPASCTSRWSAPLSTSVTMARLPRPSPPRHSAPSTSTGASAKGSSPPGRSSADRCRRRSGFRRSGTRDEVRTMNTPARTMVAMRASGTDPGSLARETLPVPEPGPGELLVEVRATAVTAGELAWLESWPAIP
jgi:hypothetical protein